MATLFIICLRIQIPWEIVALTLHCCFDYATIVTDSAIELDEICFLHTYILCSFALFSTFFIS